MTQDQLDNLQDVLKARYKFLYSQAFGYGKLLDYPADMVYRGALTSLKTSIFCPSADVLIAEGERAEASKPLDWHETSKLVRRCADRDPLALDRLLKDKHALRAITLVLGRFVSQQDPDSELLEAWIKDEF